MSLPPVSVVGCLRDQAPRSPFDSEADREARIERLANSLAGAVEARASAWWTVPGIAPRCRPTNLESATRVALGELAAAIRAGADPEWVVGDRTVPSAVRVADQWVTAGVPGVGAWLRGRCWRPTAARVLTQAGVVPASLVDSGGLPHLVDLGSLGLVALGWAVSAGDLTAEAAVGWLLGRPDTWLVVVERVARRWWVTVEGVGTVKVLSLQQVVGAAGGLFQRRQRPHVQFVLEVRLPAATRQRLSYGQQLQAQAAGAGDDERARLEGLVRDEFNAAVRELREDGVWLPDTAALLGMTVTASDPLLRDVVVPDDVVLSV